MRNYETINPDTIDAVELFNRLPDNRCGEKDRQYMNEVLDDGFGNKESANMMENLTKQQEYLISRIDNSKVQDEVVQTKEGT